MISKSPDGRINFNTYAGAVTDIVVITMGVAISNAEAMSEASKPLSHAVNVASDTLFERIRLSTTNGR